jgi:hypothetical protein
VYDILTTASASGTASGIKWLSLSTYGSEANQKKYNPKEIPTANWAGKNIMLNYAESGDMVVQPYAHSIALFNKVSGVANITRRTTTNGHADDSQASSDFINSIRNNWGGF